MAIARDASSPASFALVQSGGNTTSTGTSASFDPPNACLIRVSLLVDTAAGTTPTTTITNNGTGLSWSTRVERGDSEGTAGYVAIAEAYLATARTGMTVSVSVSNNGVNHSEGGAEGRAWVDVWTGAKSDQTGAANGEGSSTTNNITPTALTTTATNSRVTGVASDWNALGATTSTDTAESAHIAGIISGLRAYKASNTATASAVTLNFDANGTGAADWNWVAAEILEEASGDVSLALTGQSLTSARGSLGVALDKALTGQSLTSAQGSLSPALSITLTGQQLTSAQGTLTPSTDITLTGQLLTFGQGTIAPEGDVVVALTGQALTISQGSFGVALDKALTGQSLTSAQGTLVPDLSVALNGQGLTTAQGTLTVTGGDVTLALSGLSLSIGQGSLGASGGDEVRSSSGAGRSKRKRRYYVEIDGQDFEVSSPHEAEVLLARARTVAQAQVEKARSAPIRVNRGIQRPVIRTDSPELRQVVSAARTEITAIYDNWARDMEIAAFMAKAAEEEEEALIRLLM